MVEWFQNIFSWFVEHKDEIVLFLTSANFLTFISTIVLIVRQLLSLKKTNNSVNGLSETLETANKTAENVTNACDMIAISNENTEEIKTRVNDVEKEVSEKFDTLQQKLDAVLEVQSIVYSTMKDETARKNISDILTTAKLVDTSKRAELEQEIEKLKETIASKASDLKETVETTASKVKKVVSVVKSDSSRY